MGRVVVLCLYVCVSTTCVSLRIQTLVKSKGMREAKQTNKQTNTQDNEVLKCDTTLSKI